MKDGKMEQTVRWLSQNEQTRQALAWAAKNPAETLRLIREISHRTEEPVIDARQAESLGDLVDTDGRAKAVYEQAVDRLQWHDRTVELRGMPLQRSRYSPDQLARDIQVFQNIRDSRDRQRNAWRGTLAALGGRPFLDQIGAKRFESHNTEIRFSIPKGFTKSGIDNVRIDADPAGNYIIDFRSGPDLVETRKGVKPDLLPVVFADVTGLRI
jgi:hypothetical protein